MEEKMTLYVVLGEEGEYSERMVWVSGVFLTEEEAQAKILERSAVHRSWREWQSRYYKSIAPLNDAWIDQNPGKWLGREGAETMRRHESQAREMAGPEPEREDGERFSMEKVKLGEWRSA